MTGKGDEMLFLPAASPKLRVQFCCPPWTAGLSDVAFYLDGSFRMHFVNIR